MNILAIKAALVALAIASLSGVGYLGYSKVKAIGYAEASDKYELIIKDYNDKLVTRIDAIEVSSNTLAKQSRVNNELLAKDVSKILSSVKGKTLTIVKNGECVPNKTFSDSFGELNRSVNQSIKGSSK